MTRSPRFLERLPLLADRPILAYVATSLLVGGAFLLRAAVDGLIPAGFPYVTFFPAVLGATLLFGLRGGVFAAIASGLLARYFFIPPTHSFAVTWGNLVALLLYVFVVATQIMLIQLLMRANQQLARERETSAALAETRALLFRELQHRVSNNLQVAAALLTLQKRSIADPDAHAALDEAARRLGVIGRISRQLHDPNGSGVRLDVFLRQLCNDVVEASGRSDILIAVEAEDGIVLEPDAAIPVALIIAEAVSNAIEHGFADRDGGRIDVAVTREAHDIAVRISDNGRGLPDGFVLDGQDSLGLRIAMMLAKQLHGRLELSGTEGATARLLIPAQP